MGNSALDLLVAEMLGDVGRLHKELTALRQAVPAMADELTSTCKGAASDLAEQAKQSTLIVSAELDRLNTAYQRTSAFSQQVEAFANIAITIKDHVRAVLETSQVLKEHAANTSKSVEQLEQSRTAIELATQRIAEANEEAVRLAKTTSPGGPGRRASKLLILAILVAGLAIGYVFGKKNGIGELNDIQAMAECKNGTIQQLQDGRYCVLSTPENRAGIAAWRVK